MPKVIPKNVEYLSVSPKKKIFRTEQENSQYFKNWNFALYCYRLARWFPSPGFIVRLVPDRPREGN